MKLNEKTLYIIIIVLLIISSIGFFRSCNNRSGSNSAGEIESGFGIITNTIRDNIRLLSSIDGSIRNIATERDNYRIIAEQLQAKNTELERTISGLQTDYAEFREWQRKNIERNKNITSRCEVLGNELDIYGSLFREFENSISGLCERAESETD